MMAEWRRNFYEGTGGATDPNFNFGFVQIGPLTSGNNEGGFQIRLGQTANYSYAPNPKMPNTYMAAAFDLANPPNTSAFAGNIHM